MTAALNTLTSKRPERIVVRRYTEDDIQEMVKSTAEFCAVHPFYKTIPFSSEKLTSVLQKNITNTLFFCDVATLNDRIIAGLAAMLTGYAMSETYFSEDIIGYVIPSARGGIAIYRLIDEYVKWSIERRVHDMRISYTGDKEDEFKKLMARHGFVLFGSLYTRNGEKK